MADILRALGHKIEMNDGERPRARLIGSAHNYSVCGLLDEMGFNPSSFAWRETDGRFVLRVRFKAAEEAVVFAVHFAGVRAWTPV